MNKIKTKIPDVFIFEIDVFTDIRGSFIESFNYDEYCILGFDQKFTQDNIVFSKQNVLRGLHLQKKFPQGKLIQCIVGNIFDVAIDLRKDSQTYLKWVGVELTGNNHKQLFIPEGFAHGYCVLSKHSIVSYKCTNKFYPKYEHGILWNDPLIKIEWPIKNPILSEKDKNLKCII